VTIKKGATRWVVLIKNIAIKIPALYNFRGFLNGLLANLHEIEWSKTKDKRLCPVLFYIPGGWVVIMPECTPIDAVNFNSELIDKFYPDSTEDYHPDNECFPAEYNIPVEYKIDSFGWYKNQIVAIDYGT